jgi:predicted metal-binding membrane protein
VRGRRAALLIPLVLLPALGWAWIIALARDMYGPMTGVSAWMMTPRWDAPHLALLWAMWAVMMTAMMLPSAAPMIVLAGRAGPQGAGGAPGHETALTLGYVAVWAAFSIAATFLQWLLARLLVITPMMEASSPRTTAVLLAIAGIYQWTPSKNACLTACRSPFAFLATRWHRGTIGAFRIGIEHGASCVGCCWALMLLLFAGGVMNLTVIVTLTALVAFEKLTPYGVPAARLSGALLVVAAAWMLTK